MGTEFYQTGDTVAVSFSVGDINSEKQAVLTASAVVLVHVVGDTKSRAHLAEVQGSNTSGMPIIEGSPVITENYTTNYLYSETQCTVYLTPGELTAPA